MLTTEVKEWLVEYKSLTDAEINTFASTLAVNEKLIGDIFTLFETLPYSAEELDPVCHQLYEFYRSKEEKLKLFSLQFVATLVCLYLRCLCSSDKKACGGAETFLLGVYNLEIVTSDGTPLVESFRIPSLSKASIYHESRIPGVTEPLTEQSLRSLNPSQSMWRRGPFSQHENFNAQNRFSILSFIMQRYNNHINHFHKLAHAAICKATNTLCCTGFIKKQSSFKKHDSTQKQESTNKKDSANQLLPRIAVNSSLLIEYINAVYFAMFNGYHKDALQAVEAANTLAAYDLYSDVLLITTAILHANRRGNLRFETISLVAQKINFSLKNTITNASFKAKKLPDDIDFVDELAPVDEGNEQSVAKLFKTKILLMSMGAKHGDKNKNRDNMRRDSDTPSMKSGSGVEVAESVGVSVRNHGGKAALDAMELQPLRGRGNDDSSDGGGSSRNSYAENGDEGKQMKVSSSPNVFSKKSGFMQHGSQSASGLASLHSDSPPKALFAHTSPSSISSNAINGKSSSGSSSANSIITSVRAPSQHNKSKSSPHSPRAPSQHNRPKSSPHSPRAQSEGPSRDGSKLTSSKLPPASFPSLLSTLPPPFPSNPDSTLHSNLSEPVLTHHSSSGSQPPSPSSPHSIPSVAVITNTAKPAIDPLINQTNCSTNL